MEPNQADSLGKFQSFIKRIYGSDIRIEQEQGVTKISFDPPLELEEREAQLIQWMHQVLKDMDQNTAFKSVSDWKQLLQIAWQQAVEQYTHPQNIKEFDKAFHDTAYTSKHLEPSLQANVNGSMNNAQPLQKSWVQEQFQKYEKAYSLPAYLIYIQLSNDSNHSASGANEETLSEWMDLIFEMANTEQDRCIVVPISDQAIGIMLCVEEKLGNTPYVEGVIEECRAWVDALLGELYLDTVVGISVRIDSVDNMFDGMKQALQASKIGRLFYGGHGVYALERLALQRMMHDIVKRDFVNCENLLPRQHYELLGNELRDTALSFFRNHLNISETARVLYLHRNSLLYRLDKIREITGYDIRKFEEATALWSALNLWKIFMS